MDREKPIIITVFGEPSPKGRPRFFKKGNFVGTYTDKKTREAENDFLNQAISMRPDKPLEDALDIRILVYRSIPKNLSKKKRAEAIANTLRPVKRPDFDNYAKMVCDSLNKIFWKDDSQIVSCFVAKYYAEQPKVVVMIMKTREVQ